MNNASLIASMHITMRIAGIGMHIYRPAKAKIEDEADACVVTKSFTYEDCT